MKIENMLQRFSCISFLFKPPCIRVPLIMKTFFQFLLFSSIFEYFILKELRNCYRKLILCLPQKWAEQATF